MGFRLFLGSSAVEHSTVNRMVAGSNPARGAKQINHLPKKSKFPEIACVCIVSANALRIRGFAMSDELDWNFVDKDDAKAEIRAAVENLLRDATGGARGDIVTFLEFGKRTAGVSRVGLPGRAPGDYLLRCFMNIRMT